MIIDTLDGRKIENYSLDIAESWKIGRANYNDGILMLFAMKDRQVRIKVGYGLENIIRDEIADKIIRELINPEFKIKNYYIGISNSIDSISNLIYSHQELIGTKPKW